MVPTLSLVIPAYNEEAKIAGDLAALTRYLDGAGPPYELLVVDDGSVDATARAAAEFAGGRRNITLLRNEQNRGKGYSVRRGVMAEIGRAHV